MNKQTGTIRVSIITVAAATAGAIYLLSGPTGIVAPGGWWQGEASSQMAFGVMGQSLPAVCAALGMVLLTALWRSPSR